MIHFVGVLSSVFLQPSPGASCCPVLVRFYSGVHDGEVRIFTVVHLYATFSRLASLGHFPSSGYLSVHDFGMQSVQACLRLD